MKDLTNKLIPGDYKKVIPGDITSIKACVFNLQAIPQKITTPPSQLIIKADQLMGLNYLLVFFPEKLLFIDESTDALEYLKLIVELIGICDSHEEFISRVYARSVKEFLDKGEAFLPFSRMNLQKELFGEHGSALRKSLNEFTQWSYLASPHDEKLLDDTLKKLSKDGKKRFEIFLLPYLHGHVIFDEVLCKRLLPCWNVNEDVPFSFLGIMPKNIDGELEPNTATFNYGVLWLNKIETFQAVKLKLRESKIRFLQFDLLEDEISQIVNPDKPAAFYTSLLYQRNLFIIQKEIWKAEYESSEGFLLLMNPMGELELIDAANKPMRDDTGAIKLPINSLQEALDFQHCYIDEGHIKDEEIDFFNKFLNDHPDITKIAEVGFNAGHSCELFLINRADNTVLSFDIMEHSYGPIGKDYIDYVFPERHRLIVGDSQVTVPKFVKDFPNEKFDLIFIDGGHEESCAAADIANCKALARPDTWVIIDDIDSTDDVNILEWSEGPTKAWNKAIESGVIKEFERKTYGQRGWAVGKYIL